MPEEQESKGGKRLRNDSPGTFTFIILLGCRPFNDLMSVLTLVQSSSAFMDVCVCLLGTLGKFYFCLKSDSGDL